MTLLDEGSQQDSEHTDNPTTADQGHGPELNHEAAKTATNLARVFSLEDKLRQRLRTSHDEFSKKIPSLLIEV